MLVVAALLLTGLASAAAAAEEEKDSTKNARKVIATLEKLGINNENINYLIKEVDKVVEGKKVNLIDSTVMGGPLLVQYKLSTRVGVRQFEMRYRPEENSSYSFTANQNGAMLNYSLPLR